MCDFAPGDEVVCVRGGLGSFPGIGWVCLAEGATYTIAAVWQKGEIGETGLPCGTAMVQLVEFGSLRAGPNDSRCGFAADRFHKVERPALGAWLSTENTIEEPKRAPVREPV
jgi:hypothetical protein